MADSTVPYRTVGVLYCTVLYCDVGSKRLLL